MDDFPQVSFSFGMTPIDVIRDRLPEHYSMSLTSEEDQKLITRIVNQGIDSHLEAVTGNFDWGKRELASGAVLAVELNGSVTSEGMLCLLRRLYEDGSDEAWALRSCILTTLDIEEV